MIRRSIFAKIFLWFWAALILVTVCVTTTTLLLGSQPLGQRWLASSLDMYGNTAVDAYNRGGKSALQKYLDLIERNSGIQAGLIDPSGAEISGRGIPARAQRVYIAAQSTGQSRFYARLAWSGASIVNRPEGRYYFVALIRPVRVVFPQPAVVGALLKFLIAILAAGLLCFLLARHFAQPIRKLQTVAAQIADGDLSVRAKPLLPDRVDELGELAQDFDRMAERIQSLLKKQQELLGDISHELRSPLTRMSVALELARRGETDSLGRMQQELDKLEALIAQILTLTKLDQSKEQTHFSPVNLLPILRSVAEDANYEGQESGKSVRVICNGDCSILGDTSLLRSALENVVRNAVRYTASNSQVEVILQKLPDKIVIKIRDCGPGIPEDFLPRIFEPFFRVSEARDRNSGGTGLGLSITQKVVHLHHGAIHASNAEGGGLQILLTFPKQLIPNPLK